MKSHYYCNWTGGKVSLELSTCNISRICRIKKRNHFYEKVMSLLLEQMIPLFYILFWKKNQELIRIKYVFKNVMTIQLYRKCFIVNVNRFYKNLNENTKIKLSSGTDCSVTSSIFEEKVVLCTNKVTLILPNSHIN